jgi:hypothetical protein
MSTTDPARARFFTIVLVRWGGVALVLLGLLIARRRIDLPVEAGYALLVIGVFEALVLPVLLARRWKSPPP